MLFNAMSDKQVQQTVISYNAAISAYAKGGQWQKAWSLFEAMPKSELAPDMISFIAFFDNPAIQNGQIGSPFFEQCQCHCFLLQNL